MKNLSILLVDEPTKGIDVGTKADFYETLDNLANAGIPIIMVSSNMSGLVSVSDRALVMNNGNLIEELSGGEISQANAMQLAIARE